MFLKSISTESISLFLLLLAFTCAEDQPKHEIHFDKIETKKGGDIVGIELKMDKSGPIKFIINSVIENFKDLSNDYYIAFNVSIAETADNEYNFMTMYPSSKTTLCAFLEGDYNENIYDVLKEYSDFPRYKECELKPAKFTIKDMPFDGTDLDDYLSNGYYRTVVYLTDASDTVVVQYDIYTHIDEK